MNLSAQTNPPAVFVPKPKIALERLVETNLPPSPRGIMQISKLLRDPNTQPRRVVEAIGYEPPLVARILRLANSPIYSVNRKVTSIQGAMAVIGDRTLEELVLVMLGSTTFSKQISTSFLARKNWEHSLAVAVASRGIAEFLTLRGTDEVFICGLLHDIGKFMLLVHDPDGFGALLQEHRDGDVLRAEKDAYGYDHSEIGALVARRWGLQEEVCYVIRHHHSSTGAERAAIVSQVVESADMLANFKGYGLRRVEAETLSAMESLHLLNIGAEDLETVWTLISDEIEEAVRGYE
jgi:putative nucleotidyltransferase with HDIG domain